MNHDSCIALRTWGQVDPIVYLSPEHGSHSHKPPHEHPDAERLTEHIYYTPTDGALLRPS